MSVTGKKWPRYFAVLVALVMIAETIAFTVTGYAKNDTRTVYELTAEDKTTAAEISNMTGVRSEEIIKLRETGKSWNEILELVKNDPGYRAQGDGTKRSERLAQTGIKEETLEKLKEEGFTEQEITEAGSLVERVIFQLDEIASMRVMVPAPPETGVNTGEVKEDGLAAYSELAGKIDPDEAVCLLLRLRSEFGSAQAVLDEYLCSLQLGLDLNLYITDKKEYLEQKRQKAAGPAAQEPITLSKIEEKMLEMLRGMNSKAEAVAETKPLTYLLPGEEKESPVPDVPVPEAGAVKPQNPAELIQQELRDLQNNGAEQNGR